MNRTAAAFVLACILSVSCASFFKSTITVNEAIAKKEEIDKANNPAYKFLVLKDLQKKRIRITNIVVKDVTVSGNIDYNFSVLVSVPHEKGSVDCYIYTQDLKTISKLVAGSTRIDAVGNFGRFFTLLDEAYTRIEVLDARIDILETK